MDGEAKSRALRALFRALPAIFLLVAGYSWFCYVAQGIAYGDLLGVRGREGDLLAMRMRLWESLGIALLFQALAVGMIAWFFSDDVRPSWQRLCFAAVLASVVDFGTYAVIRGL